MKKRHLRRLIERSGWLAFCGAIAGALGVLSWNGPRRIAYGLAVAAFLISIALMWISIRKRSQGL